MHTLVAAFIASASICRLAWSSDALASTSLASATPALNRIDSGLTASVTAPADSSDSTTRLSLRSASTDPASRGRFRGCQIIGASERSASKFRVMGDCRTRRRDCETSAVLASPGGRSRAAP